MSTAEDSGPRGRRPATVADLTEEGLLAAFAPLLPRSRRELVGNGDDCAVLTAPDGRYCVSTDVLVQGHHFSIAWSSAQEIGARAAAQNLADIAAMGARPVALVVSLVLPRATPLAWVRDLARGLGRTCEQAGAGVVGGDLSAGESLMIAVAVHGDLEDRPPVLRPGARPGDLLAGPQRRRTRTARRRHRRPRPHRGAEGRLSLGRVPAGCARRGARGAVRLPRPRPAPGGRPRSGRCRRHRDDGHLRRAAARRRAHGRRLPGAHRRRGSRGAGHRCRGGPGRTRAGGAPAGGLQDRRPGDSPSPRARRTGTSPTA